MRTSDRWAWSAYCPPVISNVEGLDMYSEIVAAIQSTKTAIDLVKAAHGLSNYSELLTAVTAVQMKLTDAITSALASQEKQAMLAERVRELENQLAEIENWKSQMQRYGLFEFQTRALAYALKQGLENGEPMHYLCTACVDKKKKTTLQPHGRFLFCPECKTDIAIEKAPPINRGGHGGSWMAV
jgi:hypothetical protein